MSLLNRFRSPGLQDKLEFEYDDITPASTPVRNDAFQYHKYGKVIQVTIINLRMSGTGQVQLGTIPYAPRRYVYFWGWDISNNPMRFGIDTGGKIYCYTNADSLMYGNCAYIIP